MKNLGDSVESDQSPITGDQRMLAEKPNVWLIAPLSPPITGAAQVSIDTYEKLARIGTVTACDVVTSGRFRSVRKLIRLAALCLKIAIAEKRPALVYLVLPGSSMNWVYAMVVLILRVLKVSNVCDHHSYNYVRHSKPFMKTLVLFGGRKTCHLFLGEAMAKSFAEKYHPKCVKIASNWGRIFLHPSSDASIRKGERLTLSFFSNITIAKGFDLFCELVVRCFDSKLPIQVLIAGPMDTPSREMYARTIDGHPSVSYLGPIGGETKDSFFVDTDILIFPSKYKNEAEPLVVIEAQYKGCFIIGTEVGLMRSAVITQGAKIFHREEFVAQAFEFIYSATKNGMPLPRNTIVLAAERKRSEAVQHFDIVLRSLFLV